MNDWRIIARTGGGGHLLILMAATRGECFVKLPTAITDFGPEQLFSYQAFYLEQRSAPNSNEWGAVRVIPRGAIANLIAGAGEEDEESLDSESFDLDDLDEVERTVHQTMLEAVGIE